MENVAEVLQTAIDLERKGREFYLEAAGRAEDTVVKAVLTALASDEEVHEKTIRCFYEALQRTAEWPEVPAELAAPAAAGDRLEEMVSQTAGAIGADATYTDVYRTAREFEERSQEFYRARAAEAADTDVRKFLQFLAVVEKTHIDMLEQLLEAVREGSEMQGS